MLVGRITEQENNLWSADCEALGAFTQGTSRADAIAMLGELVALKLGVDRAAVAVVEVGQAGAVHVVTVDATDRVRLATEVLGYQRLAAQKGK